MHLQEHTGDGSVASLRELLQQALGQPEPTVQGVVQSVLKFQGIKVTESGAGSAHGHGAVSVDMADLGECIGRVQATVSACLKRVGMGDGGEARAGGEASPARSSVLSRLGSRLSSSVPSGKKGEEAGGGVAIQFGGHAGDGAGGGGSGLYLSSD